ncbi:MAG: lysophospholipid acyltransferase family protein [Elusimicrobiota bacterium]
MLYWIARTLAVILFKVFFRLKITGKDNIPPGGFIIASNHSSLIDPPLMGAVFSRGVYFMAKKELFEIPVFGKLIRMTHAFPVNRGRPGPETIKRALKLLNTGKILLIFPEGTRKSRRARPGVSMLAHKTSVPVLPVRVINNARVNELAPLKVKIGQKLQFPRPPAGKVDTKEYRNFAGKVMERVYSL